MTEEQRERYEIAAEALERRAELPEEDPDDGITNAPWVDVAWAALDKTEHCSDCAARLLRECIEKGEVLK